MPRMSPFHIVLELIKSGEVRRAPNVSIPHRIGAKDGEVRHAPNVPIPHRNGAKDGEVRHTPECPHSTLYWS